MNNTTMINQTIKTITKPQAKETGQRLLTYSGTFLDGVVEILSEVIPYKWLMIFALVVLGIFVLKIVYNVINIFSK